MGEQALDDDQQCSMLSRVKMRMDMAGDHSIYREGSSSLSGCGCAGGLGVIRTIICEFGSVRHNAGIPAPAPSLPFPSISPYFHQQFRASIHRNVRGQPSRTRPMFCSNLLVGKAPPDLRVDISVEYRPRIARQQVTEPLDRSSKHLVQVRASIPSTRQEQSSTRPSLPSPS